jgi:hypothetical protein
MRRIAIVATTTLTASIVAMAVDAPVASADPLSSRRLALRAISPGSTRKHLPTRNRM